MILVITTSGKTNEEILQLMKDIQDGKKGRLAEYDEFIERGSLYDTKHDSFTSMFQSFKDCHAHGMSIN